MVSKGLAAKGGASGAKRSKKRGGGGDAAGGRAKLGYVVANNYTVGEAFKVADARRDDALDTVAAAEGQEAEEEEEEEQLNEYELERARNIMRNQEFLKSLGLA